MNALPSLQVIAAAHRNNPDGRLVQTDSDRIAWMDGLPVGTMLTFDTEPVNVEASRVAGGWQVSFYYVRAAIHRDVATWREVVDLLAEPPTPAEPREPRGSLLDWEESHARGCAP